MQDVYRQLRQSYYGLLAGNIQVDGNAVPVRYGMLAQGAQADNYILISSLASNNFNDDTTNYLNAFVTFTIVTRSLKNNNGDNADYIAGALYQLVYRNPNLQSVLLLSAGQVVNTTMQQDTVLPALTDGSRIIVNRVITLHHIIAVAALHNNDNIFYGLQDSNANPVSFAHTITGSPANAISVNFGAEIAPKFAWIMYPADFEVKTFWQDLNNTLNGSTIGVGDSLFEVRLFNYLGVDYWLIITYYATGFAGEEWEVRFS
jgi:hypothetical protein